MIDRDPRGLRDIVREVVDDLARQGPTASEAWVDARLAERMEAYNRRPQEELGGLSPDQAHRLLTDGWSGAGVVRLDESLSLGDLAGSSTLHNARLLMAALGDRGGARATAKGNLPRALVTDLLPVLRWRGKEHDLPFLGARNEEDIFPLHVARALLEFAGLIKRRSGRYSLTRRGATLQPEAKAGPLFALLFRTQFRSFNLAYLSGWGLELPEFQQTIAYPLLRFSRDCREWAPAEELARVLFLPHVRDRLRAAADPGDPSGSWILEHRLLRPLEAFGLAEQREEPGPEGFPSRAEYRPTRLLDRFLSFAIG